MAQEHKIGGNMGRLELENFAEGDSNNLESARGSK